ncbi:hypothetical protein ACP70R_003201 [Stipagrostis hirtigluma subsp. patula]
MDADLRAALQLIALLSLLLILRALWHLVWRPHAVTLSFARQGIQGPAYRFLTGSMLELKRLHVAGRKGVVLDAGSHDIIPALLPHMQKWVADYGRTFLFWIGPVPAIFSIDITLVKQVLTERTGIFLKDFMIPALKSLFGNGLILSNGDYWKQHRKVVLPAFSHEKLKTMSAVTLEVTEQMTQRWCDQVQKSSVHAAEIDMAGAFGDLTTEIIGRVAFGTSHREAGDILLTLHKMQKICTSVMLKPPILWYLPIWSNLRVRHLNKLLTSKIKQIMKNRVAAKDLDCSGYGDDLLGLLVEAWLPGSHGSRGTLTTHEVIEECKTFFGAGQETTANLLVWAIYLLSVHPEWQVKVRDEVIQECCIDSEEVPNNDSAATKLQLLQMVLLETSRLYPPVMYIQRKTAADVMLTDINLPQGTVISIPIIMLNRDKEIWGPDADMFNPLRFKNCITSASRDPNTLLSFSLGPRACIGKNFSLKEAQIVMAMILRKFSFTLSNKYVHKPKFLVTLTPKFGMPIILRKLRPPLERRNFTGITQEFHRNQFNFTGISQETGMFPPFQRRPTWVTKVSKSFRSIKLSPSYDA